MKKTLLFSFLFLFAGMFYSQAQKFSINVCQDGVQSVNLTGPWWGWGAGASATYDPVNDIWVVDETFNPYSPGEPFEYKIMINGGTMENLIPAGDFSCTPVTDKATYANRQWNLGDGDVTITYGSCKSTCDDVVQYGCTNTEALNYNSGATSDDGSCLYGSKLPMTFEGSLDEFSGFEGAYPEIADNPDKSGINTSDKVLKVIRDGSGSAYAGMEIFTEKISFFDESIFKMKVYSPKAGIPVELKLESPGLGTGATLDPVSTTKSNEWEELTFSWGDEHPSDTLYKLVVIFNSGTKGDGTDNSTYYLDDFRFASQTIDDSSASTDKVNITFQVDMSDLEASEDGVYLAGGSFGQDGHLMTEGANNVWSVILELNADQTYLYKFRNRPALGTWDGFEDANSLVVGGCTRGAQNDRFVNVGSDDKTIGLVKYGSCSTDAAAVTGCIDENASNYNPDAEIQAKDQYGNLLCKYTNCDKIPAFGGCIYPESFGYFTDGFKAEDCTNFGGNPCSDLNLSDEVNNHSLTYPNPAHDFITIADVEFKSVEFYNVKGQRVQKIGQNNNVIDISSLANGIYMLKITDLKGNLSHSKLIKK